MTAFLQNFQAQLARAPVAVAAAPIAAVPSIVALRDYQNDFVHKVRLEYRNGHKAVLLVAATGAGKTVVFSYIARGASDKGRRVLILAHRDTLIKQASKKLTENGVKHGIIMAGFTPAPRRQVQVASVQTIVRRLAKMKAAGEKFDLIVIDEAHLSAAKSYMDVLAAWPDALVLGVTGSPIRLDGKGLGRGAGGTFDVIVSGISIRQLIDQGYLVKPKVYGAKMQLDLSGVKKIGGEYDSEALAHVMDKPVITGSAIEAWKKHCPGVPAVAWCASVAHAKHVAEEFNAAGIPAVALSGENDAAERDNALAALTSGKIKIITFAMLLVEGVDCPAIGAVILLRPTMSLASYLQTIGRGLRTIYADGYPISTPDERHAAILAGPKGPYCFVLDHADLWRKHGFADDEREWDLEGTKKSKGKKREVEAAAKIQQCPKCWMVHEPALACPGCGHVYQTKVRKLNERDGDLEEITPEMKAQAKLMLQKQVRNAKSLAELERIGAERGYSANWALHLFNAKQSKAASFRRSRPDGRF